MDSRDVLVEVTGVTDERLAAVVSSLMGIGVSVLEWEHPRLCRALANGLADEVLFAAAIDAVRNSDVRPRLAVVLGMAEELRLAGKPPSVTAAAVPPSPYQGEETTGPVADAWDVAKAEVARQERMVELTRFFETARELHYKLAVNATNHGRRAEVVQGFVIGYVLKATLEDPEWARTIVAMLADLLEEKGVIEGPDASGQVRRLFA